MNPFGSWDSSDDSSDESSDYDRSKKFWVLTNLIWKGVPSDDSWYSDDESDDSWSSDESEVMQPLPRTSGRGKRSVQTSLGRRKRGEVEEQEEEEEEAAPERKEEVARSAEAGEEAAENAPNHARLHEKKEKMEKPQVKFRDSLERSKKRSK